MNLLRTASENKLISFVAGLILIQAILFSLTAYYRSRGPVNYSSSENQRIISQATSARSNSDLKADSATTKNETLTASPLVAEKSEEPVKETNTQPKVVKYKIAPGDTLTKIWLKNGLSTIGAINAAKAFDKAGISVGSLKLNEEIKLTFSADGDITTLEKKLSGGKTLILNGSSSAGYEATIDSLEIFETERTATNSISSSFSAAAHEVSVPSDIIDDLVDLYSGRLDFRRDLQPGDSFTVMYTERVCETGEVVEPGPIKAISIETGGKLLVAVRHVGPDGKERFFDENAQQIGNYFLRYPVRYTRISSIFTHSRFHPILKVNKPHNGVDFAAPTGTPVRSIGDGVIELAGYNGGSGNMVKIKHDDRYSSAYLHLSKITPGLRAGSRVSRGQIIGGVGSTGLSTAPHLHFALYDKEKFIDPLTAKLPVSPPKHNAIPQVYLINTLKTLKQQHNLVRLANLVGLNKSSKV